MAASLLVGWPQNPYGITIAPEQQQKFDAAKREIVAKADLEVERLSNAIPAALSPRQLEQLCAEAEQQILAQEDELWSAAFRTGPVKAANGGYA